MSSILFAACLYFALRYGASKLRAAAEVARRDYPVLPQIGARDDQEDYRNNSFASDGFREVAFFHLLELQQYSRWLQLGPLEVQMMRRYEVFGKGFDHLYFALLATTFAVASALSRKPSWDLGICLAVVPLLHSISHKRLREHAADLDGCLNALLGHAVEPTDPDMQEATGYEALEKLGKLQRTLTLAYALPFFGVSLFVGLLHAAVRSFGLMDAVAWALSLFGVWILRARSLSLAQGIREDVCLLSGLSFDPNAPQKERRPTEEEEVKNANATIPHAKGRDTRS